MRARTQVDLQQRPPWRAKHHTGSQRITELLILIRYHNMIMNNMIMIYYDDMLWWSSLWILQFLMMTDYCKSQHFWFTRAFTYSFDAKRLSYHGRVNWAANPTSIWYRVIPALQTSASTSAAEGQLIEVIKILLQQASTMKFHTYIAYIIDFSLVDCLGFCALLWLWWTFP